MRARLAFVLIVAAAAGLALGFVAWTERQPEAAVIVHLATTMPAERATTRPQRTVGDVPLAPDLATRTGSDWPAFLGPLGTAVTPEEDIAPWPTAGPPLIWHAEMGEGYTAPAICRGRCLLFDRIGDQVRCRCLHCETGVELWHFQYPTRYSDRQGYDGGPRASPVTDGCRVYLHGPEGMLHCLRLVDGELLWKVDTARAFGVVQNVFGAASSPLIYGERLLLQVGGSPAGTSDRNFMTMPNNASCIVTFDRVTGKVLYQCGADLASYASPQVALLNGRPTGLIFARGGLIGFDPASGTESLTFPFRARSYNAVNACNVLTHGSDIFLSESYEVGCVLLRWEGGQLVPRWSAKPRDRQMGLCGHWSTPVLFEGHIYGCATRHRNDAELRCVDWQTGKVRWRMQPTLGGETAGRASVILAGKQFLYLSEEGMLFLFAASPEGYTQLAAWDGRAQQVGWLSKEPLLQEPCWAGPVLARGLLYLRGKNRVACLRLR